MNVRSLVLILAALLVAGGTAFLARGLLNPQQAQPVAQAPVEQPGKKVLVAKANLPAGSFIKEEDVSWQKWPTDGVNENYLVEGQTDVGTIVGAVARKGILAGEPITEAGIARPGDRGFLAAVLTPGMRAITIDVTDPTSVAGLAFPGDRVDLLLNMHFQLEGVTATGGTAKYEPQTSETVLENVRLLATDRNLNDIDKEAKSVNTVTIEVTPKQAEMVKVATSMGSMSLSLRGLAKPDGKSGPAVASSSDSKPTVASSDDAKPTQATFLAEGTPSTPSTPSAGKSGSSDTAANEDETPNRGQSSTFDVEVSRTMVELMSGKQNQIQVVHGSSTGVTIETVQTQASK
ncbi:MAG TPA: Flp pilus assembly protein CpaB [Methylomirabilota bacterium]|nr:Flp pilus assembly protein CpaB [Methylomirabilota bacterium]